MKRTLWLALILLLVCVFAFFSCDSGDTPPTNNENNQQTTDNNNQNTESGESQTNGNGNDTSNTPTECQHAFGSWNTVKQATCTEEGKLVRTCSKCSETEESTVAKTDVHTEVIDAAVSATCTVDGKTEGKHCSVCGKIIITQTVVKASGHTEVIDPAVEATCKTKGKTEGKHCSVCNAVIIKQNDTAIVDHDYQGGACTMCKAVDAVAKQAEIDAENERHEAKLAQIENYYPNVISGLQERINNLKDAYGITYVYSDSYCYDKISDLTSEISTLQRKIASLSGSTNSSDVAERRRYEAQLTQKQNEQDMYYKCITINGLSDEITYTRAYYSEAISDENATHQANLKAIEIKYTCASNGHTIVIDKAIDPTCTVNGRTEGSHCSVCNAVLVATQTISATGHSYGDWNAVLNPTCEEAGREERICSTCTTKEENNLSALGHAWLDWEEFEKPDCINTGKNIRECSRCTSKDYQTVSAKGHQFGDWKTTQQPSCIAEGCQKRNCNNCTYGEEQSVSVINHSYDASNRCSVCQMLKPSDGLIYGLNEDGESYTVTGIGNCQDTAVVIAEYYNGKLVAAIGNNAFSGSPIVSIVIPNTITIIGEYAFYECEELLSVAIPNSVLEIGDHAFSSCLTLSAITLGCNVEKIENRAFSACWALTEITIPNSVEFIGEYAFSNCYSLESVTLGNSLTLISDRMFYMCSALKTLHIPDNITAIGQEAFRGSSLTQITMPKSIASIGNWAFAECELLKTITFSGNIPTYSYGNISHLETILLEGGITSIGDQAFKDCKALKNIIIPNSVTAISDFAFMNCTSLVSITIPDTVTQIGGGIFYGCSALVEVNLGNGISEIKMATTSSYTNGVTTIYEYGMFQNCSSLESIVIPNSVWGIGGRAFQNCTALKDIIIPNSVSYIDKGAFYECKSLASINISNSVTSIGDYAFYSCESLSNVNWENDMQLKQIGYYTFAYCKSLVDFVIPNSVTTIDWYAFYACKSLRSITIPQNVREIKNYAFYGCTSLTKIVFENTTGWWLSAGEGTSGKDYISASKLQEYSTITTLTTKSRYWSCN